MRLNRSSIALADGSGHHWGSLEVSHHLHCLVSFGHNIQNDYAKEDCRGRKLSAST